MRSYTSTSCHTPTSRTCSPPWASKLFPLTIKIKDITGVFMYEKQYDGYAYPLENAKDVVEVMEEWGWKPQQHDGVEVEAADDEP